MPVNPREFLYSPIIFFGYVAIYVSLTKILHVYLKVVHLKERQSTTSTNAIYQGVAKKRSYMVTVVLEVIFLAWIPASWVSVQGDYALYLPSRFAAI